MVGAFSLLFVGVGLVHRKDCPAQAMIPVYLIGEGYESMQKRLLGKFNGAAQKRFDTTMYHGASGKHISNDLLIYIISYYK